MLPDRFFFSFGAGWFWAGWPDGSPGLSVAVAARLPRDGSWVLIPASFPDGA
jgi:hypothetical protein